MIGEDLRITLLEVLLYFSLSIKVFKYMH
jgi:hypothetical protein